MRISQMDEAQIVLTKLFLGSRRLGNSCFRDSKEKARTNQN